MSSSGHYRYTLSLKYYMVRIRTFEFTEAQLNRVTDYRAVTALYIICVLYDDITDRYVTLLECDDSWATWISLQ
jgi:Mg2+ and Co2+ transporter CorA